jgi:hypothetical protein
VLLKEVGGRVEPVDCRDLHRFRVRTAHADEAELGPRQVEAVPECNIEDRVDITQSRQFDGEMV